MEEKPRICKESIKSYIKNDEYVVQDYPSYVIGKTLFSEKIRCEVNIAVLEQPLQPDEEAIITITPKANKPLKQIVSVYVMMDINKINRDLVFTMIGFSKGDKSFKIYFKNGSQKEYFLKMYYHVVY